jgi:hypothetical protein
MHDKAHSDDVKAEVLPQSIDLQRFEFDKLKAQKDDEREQQHFEAERKERRWSHLAIIIPLLTGIIGYFVQSAVARTKAELRFVDRQLSELYYPIQLRLKKDDALFSFWERNKNNKENQRVLDELRHTSMVKNHEQIMSILEHHSDLLLNPDEKTSIQPLMQALFLYERHVALLSALQASGDNRTPWAVDHEFEYPKNFETEIDNRVSQLEEQRRALSSRVF